MSPVAKSSWSKAVGSPRAATSATPARVTAAPSAWRARMRVPKTAKPPISTKIGIAPWRIVRLTAPVECAAALHEGVEGGEPGRGEREDVAPARAKNRPGRCDLPAREHGEKRAHPAPAQGG